MSGEQKRPQYFSLNGSGPVEPCCSPILYQHYDPFSPLFFLLFPSLFLVLEVVFHLFSHLTVTLDISEAHGCIILVLFFFSFFVPCTTNDLGAVCAAFAAAATRCSPCKIVRACDFCIHLHYLILDNWLFYLFGFLLLPSTLWTCWRPHTSISWSFMK